MNEAMRGDGPATLGGRVSRREALRIGVAGAGALALPGLLAGCGSSSTGGAGAATGTQPSAAALRPFDANVPTGDPTDLARVIAFPGAYSDPTSLSMSDAMRAAAEESGFKYVTAVANGDLSKVTSQTEEMLQRGFASTFMYPGNEEATRALSERVLDSGACIFGGAGRPYSTVQVIQDQAVTGGQLGRLAADFIRRELGGRAQVAYFNEDSTATLVPRHTAALAELKKLPGVEVVSDIEVELNPEAGANAMSTILQKHPGVNVVLGGAGPIGGAYAILESKGKAEDPGVFVASVSGSDADLEKIASGRTAYRATLTQPWPLFGWAMGLFGVRWQEGGSIPRLMAPGGSGDVELSSPEAIATFRADMKDPRTTWETKRDEYVSLWGNIDYATRGTYWRTEARLPTGA